MQSRAALLGAALVISSCVFDSETQPTTIYEQIPFAQALLDANGLSHLKADTLVEVFNPGDPHEQRWSLDLQNQALTSFIFTADVQRLTLFDAIDLADNEIASVPGNLNLKVWKLIRLKNNRLCGLTAAESSGLDKANATWLGTQRCPE